MPSTWMEQHAALEGGHPGPERSYAAPSGMVPAAYAEKAMASLLELHRELMDEKERRLELTERMSSKEQQLAEMAGYVKLLEERLFAAQEKAAEQAWGEVQARETPEPRVEPSSVHPLEVPTSVPAPDEPASGEVRRDGWRVW